MDDLVAWLRVQLDEYERVARACQYQNWTRDGASIYSGHPTEQVVDWVYDEGGWEHIALHDPARVLREVESKRRILNEHQPLPVYSAAAIARYPDKNLGAIVTCERCYTINESADRDQDEHISVDWPCPTVRLLALPYADRPGYREEWRP